MTAPVLADALGPRSRRRVAAASVVAAALLAVLALLAVRRLAARGQLDPERWRPLARPEVLRFLTEGLVATLKAAALALVVALAVGGLLALGRLARGRPLRWLAGLYVEFFRGFPLLLLLIFAFLGLPKLGVDLQPYGYLVLALAVYNSAVLAEIFRAGILSLERGQSEAAYAIGLSYWQAMALVVVPQALRRMVPAVVSQAVTLLKDTSLAGAAGVSYQELLKHADLAGRTFDNELQTLTAAAAVYVAVNASLSQVARRLEVRQRRRYKAGTIAVAGVEDLAAVGAHGEARVPAP